MERLQALDPGQARKPAGLLCRQVITRGRPCRVRFEAVFLVGLSQLFKVTLQLLSKLAVVLPVEQRPQPPADA